MTTKTWHMSKRLGILTLWVYMKIYNYIFFLGKKKADGKISTKGNISVSVNFAFLSRQLI